MGSLDSWKGPIHKKHLEPLPLHFLHLVLSLKLLLPGSHGMLARLVATFDTPVTGVVHNTFSHEIVFLEFALCWGIACRHVG
jgi:hypothetical protein